MKGLLRIAVAALPLLTFAAFTGSTVSPAAAGCHLIDCVEDVVVKRWEIKNYSCPQLWVLRNSIYDDAGYCFNTVRGRNWFSNDDCQYEDAGDVPLSWRQRKNVALFKSVEASKGCN